MGKNTAITANISTPLGEVLAMFSHKGLCLLEFIDKQNLTNEIHDVYKYVNNSSDIINQHIINVNKNKLQLQLQIELDEYFQGKRQQFSIPLHFIGSDFQKKTWDVLLKIEYGTTISYKEQAMQYGNAKAVRAIANANGKNKIVIIVPCHRVIGHNGDLVGYSSGIKRKQALLHIEKYRK